MKVGLSLALACGVAALPLHRAWACSTCSAGDPALLGSGVEQPFAGRLRLSLSTREWSDATGSGASLETMHELRFDLGVAWSPISWLTLVLDLPLAHRWLDGDSGGIARGFGPGELEVGARAAIWRDREKATTHRLSLAGMLKLPTAVLLRDEVGMPKPLDVQLGTGSVDPRVELSYAGRFGRWTVLAGTSLTLPIGGWMLLRPAPSWRATTTLLHQPLTMLAIRAGVEARYEGVPLLAGVRDPMGSGFLGSATAGLLFSPTPDVVVDLGVMIPVIERRVDAVSAPLFSAAVAVDLG